MQSLWRMYERLQMIGAHWSLLHRISVVLYTLFHIHSVNGPRWQRCRFSEGLTAVRWHYAISWAKLCLGRGAFYNSDCSILFRLLSSAYQDPNRPIWAEDGFCLCLMLHNSFRRQHQNIKSVCSWKKTMLIFWASKWKQLACAFVLATGIDSDSVKWLWFVC